MIWLERCQAQMIRAPYALRNYKFRSLWAHGTNSLARNESGSWGTMEELTTLFQTSDGGGGDLGGG